MQSFIRRKQAGKTRKAGLTLIEIGIVIAVFALIIIGILTALGVANQSREMTQVTGDLSNIRTAITKWAGGGPVNRNFLQPTVGGMGVTTVTSGLTAFNQFWALLPAPLQQVGRAASGLTLMGVNPWGGDYVLSTTSAMPWEYSIQVTGIEAGLVGILENQLTTSGDALMVSTGTNTLTVQYRN